MGTFPANFTPVNKTLFYFEGEKAKSYFLLVSVHACDQRYIIISQNEAQNLNGMMPSTRKKSPPEDDSSHKLRSATSLPKTRSSRRDVSPSKTRLQLEKEKNELYPQLPSDSDDEEEDEDVDEVDFLRHRSGSNSFNSSISGNDSTVFEGESPLKARLRKNNKTSSGNANLEDAPPDKNGNDYHKVSGRSPIHRPSLSPRKCQPPTSGRYDWLQEYVPQLCAFCIVIALIVIVVFGVPFISEDKIETLSSSSEELDYEKIVTEFGQKMKLFKQESPVQNPKIWKILSAATKSVLRTPSPIQPAVVLMASTPGGRSTMKCLAQKFGNIVHDTLGLSRATYIETGTFRNNEPDFVKEQMDTLLHEDFQRGHRAAILDDIQNVPPTAALMLHAYCDNVNAPYKNVVIVLTVTLETDVTDATELHENDVESYLTRLWKGGLDDDKIGALLSRVANNIVIIKNDENVSC